MDFVVVDQPSDAEILALVSAAELKASLRITNSVEDAIATRCIRAAYDWLAGENGWLNRTLITTTYLAVLPGWVKPEVYSSRDTGGPATRWVRTSSFELPKPPLVSVQSVKYLADSVLETVDSADYVVSTKGLFGRVSLAHGSTWPTTDTHPEAVQIAFTAGYGTGAQVKAKCPGIEQAILLLAADAFRNREDTYAEPRLVAVNRKIRNGVQFFAGRYRIENKHA